MKHIIALVAAFFIVYVIWHILAAVLFPIVHIAIGLALLAAFCYAVYAVYKMLSQEKQIM